MAFILTAVLLAGFFELIIPRRAFAANFLYITDIRLASGENAFEELEDAGYNVMAVGLNAGTADTTPVNIGYKLNEGAPVTDIVIRENVGDSFDTGDGLHYVLASDVDVDEGSGKKAGCVYFTRDERAGEPLVGLDIVRADSENNEELLAIPNDGSRVVKDFDGTPADLEVRSDSILIYLLMIRDNTVRPYISELGIVTDTDRWNAVYTAAERGYDYFIEGDIDASAQTYTIIAYNRTADPADAVTSVMALSEELADALEEDQILALPESEQPVDGTIITPDIPDTAADEPVSEPEEPAAAEPEATEEPEEAVTETELETEAENETEIETETETVIETEPEAETETEPEAAPPQETLTAEAVDISGIEYVRVSSSPVQGEVPYYLYSTKVPEAGNPISMMYTGQNNTSTESFFGMWIYGFFSSKGVSRANTYSINEDLLEELKTDMTVYLNVPVSLLSGTVSEADGEKTVAAEVTALPLSFFTKKEGLPENRVIINGLKQRSANPPVIERTERSERENKFAGSAFGEIGIPILIGGGIAALAAIIVGIFIVKRKKNSGTEDKEAEKKSQKTRQN